MRRTLLPVLAAVSLGLIAMPAAAQSYGPDSSSDSIDRAGSTDLSRWDSMLAQGPGAERGQAGKRREMRTQATRGQAGINRIFARLDLSAEQRGKVEAIRTRHVETTRAKQQELATKQRELAKLITSASATRDQALGKQREVDALQAELHNARVSAWFEARAVLTPEQLKQLGSVKPGGQQGRKMGRGQGRPMDRRQDRGMGRGQDGAKGGGAGQGWGW